MAEAYAKPPVSMKRKAEGKNMKLMKQVSIIESADSLRTSSGVVENQATSISGSGMSQFKRTYHL